MKSKLAESQHIDICKPINLLNKKMGRQKSAKSHTTVAETPQKKQSLSESWKANKCWTKC